MNEKGGGGLCHPLARLIIAWGGGGLLAAGVLSDGFSPFTDGVFAQFSWEVEADGRLDLAAGDRVLLVVVSQSGGLGGDTLEDVVDERVHDAHCLAGDASVGVNLLQDLVDVDGITLFPSSPPGLLTVGFGSAWPQTRRLFLSFLCRYFSRHGGVLRRCFLGQRSRVELYFARWDHFGRIIW